MRFGFPAVSIMKLARTPIPKANTFALSSSEFTGEAADKDGCCLWAQLLVLCF